MYEGRPIHDIIIELEKAPLNQINQAIIREAKRRLKIDPYFGNYREYKQLLTTVTSEVIGNIFYRPLEPQKPTSKGFLRFG